MTDEKYIVSLAQDNTRKKGFEKSIYVRQKATVVNSAPYMNNIQRLGMPTAATNKIFSIKFKVDEQNAISRLAEICIVINRQWLKCYRTQETPFPHL